MITTYDLYFFIFLIFLFLVSNIFIFFSMFTFFIFLSLAVLFYGLYWAFASQFFLSTFIIIILINELVFILSMINLERARSLFKKRFFFKKKMEIALNPQTLIDDIKEVMSHLAADGFGALVLIQNKDNLIKKFLKNSTNDKRGTFIKGLFTKELLECIFFENNALHDGAVIICDNMIYAANVFIPCEKNYTNERFGGRHVAAYTASIETDATVMLLSEEEKKLSIIENGKIVFEEEYFR